MITPANIEEYIRLHGQDLQYVREIPESPLKFIFQHFEETTVAFPLLVLYGLLGRGASRSDCARYALDDSIDLPFVPVERSSFDFTIQDLRAHDLAPQEIAQILELMALFVEVVRAFMGQQWNGEVVRA